MMTEATNQAQPERATLDRASLEGEVRRLLVERLRLEVAPDEIDAAAPLFGEGLGLDSIDALEIVLALEQTYGLAIEDEQVGAEALSSVDAIVSFIIEQGANKPA